MKKRFYVPLYWGALLLLVGCDENIKRSYFENGTLRTEYETHNGQNHGYWKQYDSVGNLIMEATYVENVLDGPHRAYYDNGQIEEEHFISKGLLKGPYTKYYRNGVVRERGNCLNDTLHGEVSTYDSLGNLITMQTFCNGILCGAYKEYYPDGTLSATATYGIDGVLNGPYKMYYRNGKVIEEGTNLNGKANGLVTEYDSLGTVRKVTNYFKKK